MQCCVTACIMRIIAFQVSNPSIQFMIYESSLKHLRAKRAANNQDLKKITAWEVDDSFELVELECMLYNCQDDGLYSVSYSLQFHYVCHVIVIPRVWRIKLFDDCSGECMLLKDHKSVSFINLCFTFCFFSLSLI